MSSFDNFPLARLGSNAASELAAAEKESARSKVQQAIESGIVPLPEGFNTAEAYVGTLDVPTCHTIGKQLAIAQATGNIATQML